MPIVRGLKSLFAKKEAPVVVNDSSLEAMKQIIARSIERHIPSGTVDKASELYSQAVARIANFRQDKSNGELIFMGSILAAVLLFAVVLPMRDAFSSRTIEGEVTKRSTLSSNSSATESLDTIEESEEEDIPDPIEVIDALKFVDDDGEVQVYDDQPFQSLATNESKDECDADDRLSDSTPVTIDEAETPTASPCVTPVRTKPTLTKKFVSVSNIASSTSKRSSFAKMKGKMTSSMSFRRKDSTDASVTSTSSNRSFRVFSIKSKKD
jgi:hypothetical protein